MPPKTQTRSRVIVFNKPYGVLSQFTREGKWLSLADFGPFPRDVYAAGRLDADSEGMLILTNDNRIKEQITHPRFTHPRTYLAQVERIPEEDEMLQLSAGVVIEGKKTKDCAVRLLTKEPDMPPRIPPIRFRKNIPTSWIEITLREGRNRQVRKMTAAVGHPTLRLIRIRIGNLHMGDLAPGKWMELSSGEIGQLLAARSLPEHKTKPRH